MSNPVEPCEGCECLFEIHLLKLVVEKDTYGNDKEHTFCPFCYIDYRLDFFAKKAIFR